MKNYIFLLVIAALSIMTFTACGNPSDMNAETSAADTTAAEAATISISETTSVTPETTTTAETTSETASETTTETVSETTAAAETEKPEKSPRPEPVLPPDTISIDTGSFYDGDEKYSIDINIPDENNICVLYKFKPTENSNVHAEMRIFDPYSGEENACITIPESRADNYFVRYGKAYGDDVLCMIYGTSYIEYINDYTIQQEIKVYKDYSYEPTNEYCYLHLGGRGMTIVGDHKISISAFDNFYDADSGEIILNSIFEGFDSKNSKRYSFNFVIDENRFVYSVRGYEWKYCIGIYDFTTGTAQDIPNTYDAHPVGIYNGKIYSYYCSHDGFTDNKLYATDINTLETTELYEFSDDYGYYDDILILKDTGYFLKSHPDNTTLTISLNDLNSGNVVKEYKFENIYNYTYRPMLIGNRAAVINTSNGILYIFNL